MTSRSDAIRVDPGSRATEGSSTYTIPPKSAGGAGSAGLGRKWPSSPPRTVPDRGLGGPLKRGCQTLRTGRSGRRSKKCTFCWVFNNSPSRDKIRHFFRTAISTNPHFWGISNGLGTKTGPKKGGFGRSKIRPPARAEIFRIFAARPPAEKRPFFDPFSGVEKGPKSTLFGGVEKGSKTPFLAKIDLPQGIPGKPQKRPFRAPSGDPPYRGVMTGYGPTYVDIDGHCPIDGIDMDRHHNTSSMTSTIIDDMSTMTSIIIDNTTHHRCHQRSSTTQHIIDYHQRSSTTHHDMGSA